MLKVGCVLRGERAAAFPSADDIEHEHHTLQLCPGLHTPLTCYSLTTSLSTAVEVCSEASKPQGA